MFRAHLRATQGGTAQTGVVNDLPRLQIVAVIRLPRAGKPRRIAERRSCAAVLGGLGFVPFAQLVLHPRVQRLRLAFGGREAGSGDDISVWQSGLAIGKLQIVRPKRDLFACAGDRVCADEIISSIGTIAARVHPYRAANATRDCAQEGQVQPRVRCLARDMGVQRRGACGDDSVFAFDGVEPAPQPDHHSAQAAVAHDHIRPDPHRHDHDIGGQRLHESRQIIRIGRLVEIVSRAAHAQPGQISQGAVLRQLTAHIGKGNICHVHRLARFGREVNFPHVPDARQTPPNQSGRFARSSRVIRPTSHPARNAQTA